MLREQHAQALSTCKLPLVLGLRRDTSQVHESNGSMTDLACHQQSRRYFWSEQARSVNNKISLRWQSIYVIQITYGTSCKGGCMSALAGWLRVCECCTRRACKLPANEVPPISACGRVVVGRSRGCVWCWVTSNSSRDAGNMTSRGIPRQNESETCGREADAASDDLAAGCCLAYIACLSLMLSWERT